MKKPKRIVLGVGWPIGWKLKDNWPHMIGLCPVTPKAAHGCKRFDWKKIAGRRIRLVAELLEPKEGK